MKDEYTDTENVFTQIFVFFQNNNPVSEECAEKVHEAIRQRAMDVNLNPDLDMACRHDLGEYCSQTPHQQGTVSYLTKSLLYHDILYSTAKY